MNLNTRLHAAIRLIYLFVTASVLPLALLYLKKSDPVFFASFSGFASFILVLGGVFWGIFFIFFEQRYFPFSLKKASITLLSLLGTFFSASNLGEFNVLYGAYSILIASLASQALFFLSMTFLFHFSKRKKKLFYYTNPSYFFFLLFGFLLLAFFLYLFHRPWIQELLSEPTLFWRLVFLFSFGFYLFWDVKNFFTHNMFQFDKKGEKEKRDEVLEKWAVLISLLMIFSIVLALVLIFV